MTDEQYNKAGELLKEHFNEIGCSCCTGIHYEHKTYKKLEFELHADRVQCKNTSIVFYGNQIDNFEIFLQSIN